MRLLFLNRSFPVLSQTFVLDQIASAVDAGHETTVAALKLSDGVEHPVVQRLNLYRTILYSRPLDRRNAWRIFKAIAGRPQALATLAKNTTLGRPTLTETAIALQMKHKPDVIVANFGPSGISAVRLKQVHFPNAKVVVVFHGYDISGYVEKRGWGNYQRMAPGVDLAVCVNSRWEKLLREKTTMSNIVVHHLGVDCAAIKRRSPAVGRSGDVLFVGRMTEKKGFDHLIRALMLAAETGTDMKVKAIGDGPLLASYRQMVRDLDLEGRVEFYGMKPHDFILAMMQKADVLVAPSVTASDGDQEGIPVVLMEAMASGVPVVATRHSGIPELVVDGQSGLLVDEGDDAALAHSIGTILQDPVLGERLAAAAYQRVLEHFNSANQNSEFFRLIENL